jgi:tetratricopeptide (TPR) repeat protein
LNETWRDAFQNARESLSGVELGRVLLNEGGCLSESNQRAEARTTWLEALPHFKSHPKLLAWTRYNLGISALQDLEPEAEHHFLEAVSLTKNPKAAEMRSAVFRGLGASRRVFGEWDRAEFAYRQAVQTATALDDREEAHIGLARTLRLAGRPSKALETLELALHIYDTETPIVNIGRALAFLALNDTTHAKTALEKVGTLVSVSDQWLYRIASAELARREGRLTDAVGLLEGLPVHSLHPREEVRQWSKLFELLALADKPVPLPLEYLTRMVVRVQAAGALRVAVNGRGVQLVPTHRPGELLVFLLENDGVASLDQIRDALYPDAVEAKDKERTQKSIWKLVDALRHALGWESAVLSLRGAYQLDPNVTWDYDIRHAREAGRFKGEFLKGVYSNWAIETGQLLSELAPDSRQYRPLN